MRRKIIARLLLTLLLTNMLTLMHNVGIVKAQSETIYIRPDGSIDPPTAPIQRDGDIYTFTDNIYATIVVQRDNIIVDGNGYMLQGAGNATGFDLSNRNNVTIKKTYITKWDYGVHLYNVSSSNIISDNNFTSNVQRGIFVSNSSSNIISRNRIVNNVREGIFLWVTNSTIVTGNNVSNNGEDGISIGYSSFNNTIINNTVSDNSWAGIALGFETPGICGNVITGNNITHNDWVGIYIDHSHGNTFHHNNLDNNTNQVLTVGATNIWNDDYPSGGNYWSDYIGEDNFSGPYQNETGEDGIGDNPYIIDESNIDRYPLMKPFTLQRILVYTNNYTYHVGVSMHLGLHVVNLEYELEACVAVWLEFPSGSIHLILHAHNVTLPAELDYNNPSFKSFTLPNITPGIYTWYATLLNPATHTIITEDTAQWEFT